MEISFFVRNHKENNLLFGLKNAYKTYVNKNDYSGIFLVTAYQL